MWPTVKPPLLEARQPSANSCAIPIISTYITTITHVLPSTTTFERYITDSQADKTTTITQTILEAIERTTTSQLSVVTTFCAPSPSSTRSSSIPIGIDKSTSLSYASSFFPSPTSTTTAPTASPTSGSTSPPPPSKTSAIIAAATIPIVVFVIAMWTFCFFRRRTEKKKIADLEHIAIEPQTPTQSKAALPASTTLGTTVVGEYIPEDSISFVQHTNPPNPVDHSLESTVAPSQIQQGFNRQSASAPYRQFVAPNPPEDIHYDPSASQHNINIKHASGAPRTSDDSYQPVLSSALSLAINQLTEMTNQNLITSSARTAVIKHSAEMANQQPPASRPRLVAIDQLPGLANYQPPVTTAHYFEPIMDLLQPVNPIPQTPPPSEAARQRSPTDALRRLEGEAVRPYSTIGLNWRNLRHLGARDLSLPTVQEELDDDDVPLAELKETLRGQAQQVMYRPNGPIRYRDAGEAEDAATQRRRARDEEEARQGAIRAENLPDIARMARQEEAARQGQMRLRGALPPNAQREREVSGRPGPGGRDRGYTTDAAEASLQRFTAEDMRVGIEERDGQRQLEIRFYGGLPQDTDMVRGAGDGHRLDTRGRSPPMDDFAAFQAAGLEREGAEEQERELRRQIAEGVEYRQRRTEERRERIRGEGVTDTRLTDFDVDAVNLQTANQPPRPKPMNFGRLDGSQVRPHAMPRPDLPNPPPKIHMRRAHWEEGQRIARVGRERAWSGLTSGSGEVPCQRQTGKPDVMKVGRGWQEEWQEG